MATQWPDYHPFQVNTSSLVPGNSKQALLLQWESCQHFPGWWGIVSALNHICPAVFQAKTVTMHCFASRVFVEFGCEQVLTEWNAANIMSPCSATEQKSPQLALSLGVESHQQMDPARKIEYCKVNSLVQPKAYHPSGPPLVGGWTHIQTSKLRCHALKSIQFHEICHIWSLQAQKYVLRSSK